MKRGVFILTIHFTALCLMVRNFYSRLTLRIHVIIGFLFICWGHLGPKNMPCGPPIKGSILPRNKNKEGSELSFGIQPCLIAIDKF